MPCSSPLQRDLPTSLEKKTLLLAGGQFFPAPELFAKDVECKSFQGCTPTWPKCERSALRLQWKLLLKPTGAKYRTTRLLFKLAYQGGSCLNLPWTWEYRGVHPCAALRLQLHHSTACTLRLARGSTLSLTSDQLVPSGGVHQARCLNCATRPIFVYLRNSGEAMRLLLQCNRYNQL